MGAGADTAAVAPAGAGEAMSELTYAGMAALLRSTEPADGDGDCACLPLTRLLLGGFAIMSISAQDVYISVLPLGRFGSFPGKVPHDQIQYNV